MEVNQCPFTGIVYAVYGNNFYHIKEQEGITYLCTGSDIMYKRSKGAVYQSGSLFHTCSTTAVFRSGKVENLGKYASRWWYDPKQSLTMRPLGDVAKQSAIQTMADNLFRSLAHELDEYTHHCVFTPKYYNMLLDALEDKSLYPHRNLAKVVQNQLPPHTYCTNLDDSITVTREISKGTIICNFDNEWDWFKNHRLFTSDYALTNKARPYSRAKAFFEAIDATR